MLESMQVKEWQEQAREEARLETTRAKLLLTMEKRFKKKPAALVKAVNATADIRQLDRWFETALTANSLAELQAALKE